MLMRVLVRVKLEGVKLSVDLVVDVQEALGS